MKWYHSLSPLVIEVLLLTHKTFASCYHDQIQTEIEESRENVQTTAQLHSSHMPVK